MRKIIALTFLSLDGVMQAPGGPTEDTEGGFKYGGWLAPYFDEVAGELMGKQMSNRSDLLLGRKTFEIFASYWPQHADQWPGINDVTKYVVSTTLSSHPWSNSVFLGSDFISQLRELKSQTGPDLQIHGSSQLLHSLFQNDLIDELWFKTFPVILGEGKRLFTPDALPSAFTLFESHVTPKGVIFVSYKRSGEVKTGSVE